MLEKHVIDFSVLYVAFQEELQNTCGRGCAFWPYQKNIFKEKKIYLTSHQVPTSWSVCGDLKAPTMTIHHYHHHS